MNIYNIESLISCCLTIQTKINKIYPSIDQALLVTIENIVIQPRINSRH